MANSAGKPIQYAFPFVSAHFPSVLGRPHADLSRVIEAVRAGHEHG